MAQSLQTQKPSNLVSRFKRRLRRTFIGGGLGAGAILLVSILPTTVLLIGGFVGGALLVNRNRAGKKNP